MTGFKSQYSREISINKVIPGYFFTSFQDERTIVRGELVEPPFEMVSYCNVVEKSVGIGECTVL